MHFIKSVAKSVKESVDSVNLKLVTKESLDKSDEIKTRVRAKLATLSAEQQKTSEYAGIVATHEQIEKNHDAIYRRPESGVNPNAAEAECKALLVLQQELESTFNLAFATLTGDEKVVVENTATKADLIAEDAVKSIEETKDAAIAKANEVADQATAKAEELKDGASEAGNDMVNRVSNAISDVKKDLTTSAPRPKA